MNEWLIVALGALALVVVVVVLVLRGRSKPSALPPQKAAEPLPEATRPEAPRVQLAPSEVELQKRAEVDAARAEAEAAKAKRQQLAWEAHQQAEAAQKEKLEAEARALRETEEDAKKQAYRAQKALEVEEKERKKREREEAERLAAEAKAKAEADAAAAAAEAKRAEQRRIDAQAGQTLAIGLSKTRNEGFISKLNGLFGGGNAAVVDERMLGSVEEILFTADIGVKTAQSLLDLARERAKKNELADIESLKKLLRREIARIVELNANVALTGGGPPHVVMVVGVNGSGKTTTIGKLASRAVASGKKVVVAAGDTFRAAAAEQLDVWAERSGATIIKGKEDSDPAAVVFDAVKKGIELKADLVIADTAGRLHTKAPLMEELKKVKRVIDKALPGAPHEVLLVLDSTNGQNAIAQARQFHDAVGVTGICLTKLDGTAKGGVIIGICDELRVPVAWVGVGEKVADLRPFNSKEFVEALFD